jgi:ribonuclease P protein component
MLAKKFKLNIGEFIQKRPTFVKKGPFFAVKYIPNGLSYSRFGVVIGKKIDKRATERNRIRRIFYRVMRERNLQAAPGQDVMIQVYPEIKQFSKEEIANIVKGFEFGK